MLQEGEIKKVRIQTPKDTSPVFSYLSYQPLTGEFIWKKSPATHKNIGDVAGTKDRKGYIKIQLKGKQYYGHRLAFDFMGEPLEKGEYVDHIDRDTSNNRWVNLRKATPQENSFNRKVPNTNTSGSVGVCWDKYKNKWRVYCQHKHFGYFDEVEDAENKYQEVSSEQYGKFKYEAKNTDV